MPESRRNHDLAVIWRSGSRWLPFAGDGLPRGIAVVEALVEVEAFDTLESKVFVSWSFTSELIERNK